MLKRHLNIVIGLSLLAYAALGLLFLSDREIIGDPFILNGGLCLLWVPLTFLFVYLPNNTLGDVVPQLLNVIFLAIPFIPLLWALNEKNRSKAWLWLVLIPLGWVSFLFLKNKKHYEV